VIQNTTLSLTSVASQAAYGVQIGPSNAGVPELYH
jgi:hypothetical protein